LQAVHYDGLYPTHADYVTKYTQAADTTLAAGFLLKTDYDDGIKAAKRAPIPEGPRDVAQRVAAAGCSCAASLL
jgi:hypothetical protein